MDCRGGALRLNFSPYWSRGWGGKPLQVREGAKVGNAASLQEFPLQQTRASFRAPQTSLGRRKRVCRVGVPGLTARHVTALGFGGLGDRASTPPT